MRILIALTCAMMAGCAGVTEYKVTTPDGVIVEVRNTKDYDTYSLNAAKQADGSYSVELKETGVSASDPLKAARDLNSVLLDKLMTIAP